MSRYVRLAALVAAFGFRAVTSRFAVRGSRFPIRKSPCAGQHPHQVADYCWP